MAFEIFAIGALILTVVVFPVLMLMLKSYERIEFKYSWKKYAFLLFSAFIISLAAASFALEYEDVFFGNPYASYGMFLLLAILIYLITFNRYKG